ncbi:MAG: TIGR04551 family protein [Deltaproteobacteria bacterium]|nr:TIGR04551 family protein [Deltaproteobacteria bacterium]
MTRTFPVAFLFTFVCATAAAQTEPADPAGPTTPAAEAVTSTEEATNIDKATGTKAPAAEEIPSLDEVLKDKALDVASQWEGPGASSEPEYPWFEHHGYFRLRVDGYYRGHLGTHYTTKVQAADGSLYQITRSTSGFLPPLTENIPNTNSPNSDQVGPQGEDWLAGANLRFRYRPTLHVSDNLSINAEFDVLDNMILGSTPDYDPARSDAPLSIFASTQAPPSAGMNSVKDSIRVKQAWFNWNIMTPTELGAPLLALSAGRMARHWGLGIVENDGEDLDANYGTYVDRITLLARLGGIYFEAGYGWVASGPTAQNPALSFGEPIDLTNSDDVTEVTLAIFSKPMTQAERKERFKHLNVHNKVSFDWGAYAVYRRQKLDSFIERTDLHTGDVIGYDVWSPGDGIDNLQLLSRDAWTVTPDLWLRLEWVPAINQKFRLELEVAGVVGHIGSVNPAVADSSMDIRSFGAALEFEYQMGNISFGFDAGIATGDKTNEAFGYLDQSIIDQGNNPKLAAFYFHPDYFVDNLLFRKVIGTVTNAWYIRPWFQYDLFESENDSLAARLDIVYGRALEANATPGNDPNLGVELDLKIFYEEKGLIYAGLEWAVLWPLAGFNLVPGHGGAPDTAPAASASWSTALRARVGIMF